MNLTVTTVPARIHEWCGRLDDPARDQPCPCRANRSTRLKVELRHQDAVKRARGEQPAPAGKTVAAVDDPELAAVQDTCDDAAQGYQGRPLVCRLDAGHALPHRNGDGATWQPVGA